MQTFTTSAIALGIVLIHEDSHTNGACSPLFSCVSSLRFLEVVLSYTDSSNYSEGSRLFFLMRSGRVLTLTVTSEPVPLVKTALPNADAKNTRAVLFLCDAATIERASSFPGALSEFKRHQWRSVSTCTESPYPRR